MDVTSRNLSNKTHEDTNCLWDRRLESGRQRALDLSPRGSAAASQADGNSGGEHLPREQWLFAASWNNSFECTGRSHSDEGVCSARRRFGKPLHIRTFYGIWFTSRKGVEDLPHHALSIPPHSDSPGVSAHMSVSLC
jgi:hypothetical protein